MIVDIMQGPTSGCRRTHPFALRITKRALAPLAASSLLAFGCFSVQAQNAPDVETPAIVTKLFDCRAIEDAGQRLACFDREVDAVAEAQASRDLVIADREQIKKERKGLFGFTLPKVGLFGGGDDEAEKVKEVTEKIAEFRRLGSGKHLMVLENGARWIQIDNKKVYGNPEPGEDVRIKRASMGSYFAKIGKRRPIRMRRLN